MREVTRGGVTWEVDEPSVGGYQFWNDWENAGWEQSTLDVLDQFVTPESTFVDIGAWIGPVSLWASHLAKRVISVEPDPVALRYLRKNAKANKAPIKVIPAAISNHTGYEFITASDDGWGSSMTRLTPTGKQVSCWTLPDLFEKHKIENVSLVKMDIEGAESLVLEQIAPFLASQEIPLLVAMHEPWWERQIERSWFGGYSDVIGSLNGWGQVLAIP